MIEKKTGDKTTPPVIPTNPTPTRVLVRELKSEPAPLVGERTGGVTWEQPTSLQSRQYPLWYRYRAAIGSLIIVNICIGTYVLATVKPKPKKQERKRPEHSQW